MRIKASFHPIFIGSSVLKDLTLYIWKNSSKSKLFILTDSHVYKHCLPVLLKMVPILKRANIIEIKSGEKNKSIISCSHVWRKLLVGKAEKNSLLINVGGGSVTDLGGFAATTYKRGIPFINVPTTLLAQVDASIGGKNGINFSGIKNIIGTINQPKAVFIYPGLISTLPEREILSGLAEALKHGLIADANYWRMVKNRTPEKLMSDKKLLLKVVTGSVRIKTSIVSQDAGEKNVRKLLNFGHTVGHALEGYHSLNRSSCKITHGEAVAAGMIIESYISHRVAGLSHEQLNDITQTINNLFAKVAIHTDSRKTLIRLMRQDKKNRNEKINFTLLKKTGSAAINHECNGRIINQALEFYNGLSNKAGNS